MTGFPKRKRMGLVSHAATISHHDVALAEKVSLELVQVIFEKLDCDVLGPLAR
jgi:hypothetical protein